MCMMHIAICSRGAYYAYMYDVYFKQTIDHYRLEKELLERTKGEKSKIDSPLNLIYL